MFLARSARIIKIQDDKILRRQHFKKGRYVMSSLRNSTVKQFLLISDFDQTLSFNDSGIILSELLGISGFQEKIAGLSQIHLVQQGGELAYLLLHDPEYRRVRKHDLMEARKRIV